MKLCYIKILKIIFLFITVSANLISQDMQNRLPSLENLPPIIKEQIHGLSESEQIKKLQSLCWDLRYTNSVDAIKAGQASLDLAKKNNDNESISQGLSFLGVIYLHISDYTVANDYFLQSLEVAEINNLMLQKGYAYNNLSHLFRYMKKIDKAFENIWISKEIMEQIDDKRGLSYAYLRLSDLYLYTQDWDSAYYYASESVKLRKEVNHKKLEARAMLNVGEALEGQKKYQKALDIYLEISDDIEEIGKIEIYIANAYFKLKNHKMAIIYAQKAYDKTKDLSLYQQLLDATRILSETYKELGDFNSALNFSQLQFNYRDSIFTFEKNRQVEILNYTYELDKTEKANQELIERGKEKDRLILFYIISLVVLMIGSIVLFISRKKIKAINNLLHEKNIEIQKQSDELHDLNATKDKFFSIIAHDLKNPIGSFKNVTDFFKEHFEELEIDEQLEFIKTLSESSNQVYELLENLLEWSRIQRGSIGYHPIDFDLFFVSDNCIKLLQNAADQKKIKLNNYIPNDTLVCADINMITTVIRNLVSNSIKFTNEFGNINISIKENTSLNYTICVEDSGIGMSQETINKLFRIDTNITTMGTANEKGTGLGLILCKEFVEKNNGSLWVESKVGIGSSFYFTINKGKNE